MVGINQNLGLRHIDVVVRGSGRVGSEKANVDLCACTSSGVDSVDPFVEVEVVSGSTVGVGASSTPVGTVVVELDPQEIELCRVDHGAHVRIWEWALRSTGNDVVLGAGERLLVVCKMNAESVDGSNVTLLIV